MKPEKIAGVRVSVDRVGSGAPTLIFVHGGFCDRHDWSAQREALSAQFRVVTFDLPGHGESGLPAAKGIEALIRTASEITVRHGGGRAVLVGHSLGCRIILGAFRSCRAGIVGLVLIEGRLVPPAEANRVAAAIKESETDLTRLLEAAFEGMFVPSSDPALRRRVVSRLDRSFAQDALLSTVFWDEGDAARLLAGIDVPVLVLQSTYAQNFVRRSLEPGMTTPWTDLVTQQVAAAELRIVPGVGHFPQLEAADIVSDHIAQFLRGCARKRAGAALERM